jgi:hypothetical protein
MPRLNVIETEAATGRAKELYDACQQEFGKVFNLFKGLANAPLALLVSDEDIMTFREAGYTDEHIAEIPTILAQKTLSNFFNHIHDTPLDLPAPAEI